MSRVSFSSTHKRTRKGIHTRTQKTATPGLPTNQINIWLFYVLRSVHVYTKHIKKRYTTQTVYMVYRWSRKWAKATAEIYHLFCLCASSAHFSLSSVYTFISHILNRDLFWYYGFFVRHFSRSHSDSPSFFAIEERERGKKLSKNVKYAPNDW